MRCKHLVVVGSLFLAPSAFAGEYRSPFYTFQAGDWSGGAYRDETSGRFSHCSMSGNYRSGIILALAIDRDYSLMMTLGHSSWRLPEGEEYAIDLYIDGRYLGRFAGISRQTQLLSVNFGENRTAYDRIRYGNVMTVVAAKETFDLRLTGTARALQRVKECVDTAVALSPESGNPFSRDVTNPFSVAQGAGGQSVDYQETIEYVLSAAGIEDPIFITAEMQHLPGLVVAWEADGVNGFVLSAEDSISSMDTALVDFVGSLGEDCAGHYASAANPAEVIGTYAIKDGFGTCATSERRQISYVTGIFDESNALYFIQYSEDEGSVVAEQHHIRLKDALKLITKDLLDARQ